MTSSKKTQTRCPHTLFDSDAGATCDLMRELLVNRVFGFRVARISHKRASTCRCAIRCSRRQLRLEDNITYLRGRSEKIDRDENIRSVERNRMPLQSGFAHSTHGHALPLCAPEFAPASRIARIRLDPERARVCTIRAPPSRRAPQSDRRQCRALFRGTLRPMSDESTIGTKIRIEDIILNISHENSVLFC